MTIGYAFDDAVRTRRNVIVASAAVVVVGIVVTLRGRRGGGSTHAAAKTKTTTTTLHAKPKPPIAPLTGLPDPGGASQKRCAITVKIDNTQAGHPKYGVDQADVVYEEVVEGRHHPPRCDLQLARRPIVSVRCVRCARPTRASCGRSGASSPTRAARRTRSRRSTPRPSCSSTRRAPGRSCSAITRGTRRGTSTRTSTSCTASAGRRPAAGAVHLSRPDAPSRRRAGDVGAGRIPRRLRASPGTGTPASGTWKRSIFGSPEVVASGTQFAPQNVVVMFVSYIGGDPNHGNERRRGGDRPGTARRSVFTAGKEILGHVVAARQEPARAAARRRRAT